MKATITSTTVCLLIICASITAQVVFNDKHSPKTTEQASEPDMKVSDSDTNAIAAVSKFTRASAQTQNPNQQVVHSNPGELSLIDTNSEPADSTDGRMAESLVNRFNELMYIDSPNFSMEEKIAVEEKILRLVSENPESVFQFFELYEHSEDYDFKLAVIDVVSMIANPQVESFALNQINKETDDHTVSWLQILRSTGISSTEDRAHMLTRLNRFSDPDILSNAISTLKFRPYLIDEAERSRIVSQLGMFLYHENPIVQQAATDAIDNWKIGSENDTLF